ncbi:MAG: hypothetical protein WAS27_00350 [Candidatus Saccharimonadales bacterium]
MPSAVGVYINKFILQHRKIVGVSATVFALGIAVLYLFVVPLNPESVHRFMWVILRYGHSFCWLLLAGAAGLFAFNFVPRTAGRLAYAALVSYVVFIGVYVTSTIM